MTLSPYPYPMSLFDLLSEIPAADAEMIVFGAPADYSPVDGPSVEDETYYTEMILSGEHDALDADHGSWAEANYEPDFERPSDRECDRAEGNYTRNVIGWN